MSGPRTRLVAWAVALATIAILPVLAVIARGVAPDAAQTWTHLAQTVLPDYIANTLVLVVLVGAGAGVGGTATAWLVAHRRFPGAEIFDWALLLPLAMPAYVMAYAYTDFLQFAGPLQTALRNAFGWSRGDYWFPDVRTVGGAAAMFIFSLYPYVYLLARTAFLERPPCARGGCPHAGRRPPRRVLAGRAAARAPRDRRRHRARAHGNARRLRHRRLLRGRHVHDRDLPRMVLARRPCGGRATRDTAARVRRRRDRARADVATVRARDGRHARANGCVVN